MTWYQVPVHVWLEAPDETTAIETVLDKLHGTMRHGGPAEEISPERLESLLELEASLVRTAEDIRAGVRPRPWPERNQP